MRYTREFLVVRNRVGLVELISRYLKLQRRGHEYVGLCPFHAERTPSFTVVDGDRRFFHCFGCGAHGGAIEFVMRADNLDFRRAVAKLAAGEFSAPLSRPVPDGSDISRIERAKDERNREIAWRLFQTAEPARGALVETYLRIVRDVDLPPEPVLRFAARCWNRETGRYLPAMLARVDGANGEFLGVHRTWLTRDGRKAELRDPKMSLGPIRGGAIRLAPAAPQMAIAEGIENALSATAAWGIPAWSAVSKAGFAHLVLPAEVREVLIVADHDINGQGERAARAAGERWVEEGRRVRLWRSPRVGEDANDLLLQAGGTDNVTRGSVAGARPG